MTGWYGGDEGGHLGFSPIVPLTGRDFVEATELMRHHVEDEAGLDFMAGSLVLNERCCVMVAMIMFDTKDAVQTERAYAVVRRMATEMGKVGYGEYRAHLSFMDVAADQYPLQRPRLPPLLRAHQGRRRPQRHPVARPARHLAAVAPPPAGDRGGVGMSEVVLFVEQAVTPGLEQEAHDAIRALCEAVHAQDEGVVLYAAYDVDGDPGRIVAIERWDSQEALDTHAAKAHVTSLAASRPWPARRPSPCCTPCATATRSRVRCDVRAGQGRERHGAHGDRG